MFIMGKWKGAGVFNTEQFDPDPFMEQLKLHGLSWYELHDVDLEL
jgi:saccharopine dehydrogenase (NAD+, L-lysine-forming)